jgi:hypothetical protein
MQFAFYELVAGTQSKPELRLVETSPPREIVWIHCRGQPAEYHGDLVGAGAAK